MDHWSGITPEALKNEFFRLEILEQAGPRILRLIPAGSEENLFAYTPDIRWPSPAGDYSMLGGHRFWAAPEDPAVTYIPEDAGVELQTLPDGVSLRREDHFGVHLEKTMEIRVDRHLPTVHIVHRLRNLGTHILQAAPWAITALPIGSRVKIPLTIGNTDPQGLLANRSLILWPYTQLKDPRFTLTDEALSLQGDASENAFKIGVFTTRGWAAAQIKDWLLIKRFTALQSARYPDMGANVETYVKDRFIELETLGPLVDLHPGEYTEHVETWEIRKGTLDALDAQGLLTH